MYEPGFKFVAVAEGGDWIGSLLSSVLQIGALHLNKIKYALFTQCRSFSSHLRNFHILFLKMWKYRS
jgi:hypothetical protein